MFEFGIIAAAFLLDLLYKWCYLIAKWMVKWQSKHSILEQIVLELTVFIFIVIGSFSEKILFNSARFDLKTGVKFFVHYKNNGI